MAAGKSELVKHIAGWLASLHQATDHESWGQPVEASELYKKLTRSLIDRALTNGYRLGRTIRNVLTSDAQINDTVKVINVSTCSTFISRVYYRGS